LDIIKSHQSDINDINKGNKTFINIVINGVYLKREPIHFQWRRKVGKDEKGFAVIFMEVRDY